jgi:hypothetical protein
MSEFDILLNGAEPARGAQTEPEAIHALAQQAPKNQHEHLTLIKALLAARRQAKVEYDPYKAKLNELKCKKETISRSSELAITYEKLGQKLNASNTAVNEAIAHFYKYAVQGLADAEREEAQKIFESELNKYLNPAAVLPVAGSASGAGGTANGTAGIAGRGTSQGNKPPSSYPHPRDA